MWNWIWISSSASHIHPHIPLFHHSAEGDPLAFLFASPVLRELHLSSQSTCWFSLSLNFFLSHHSVNYHHISCIILFSWPWLVKCPFLKAWPPTNKPVSWTHFLFPLPSPSPFVSAAYQFSLTTPTAIAPLRRTKLETQFTPLTFRTLFSLHGFATAWELGVQLSIVS